MSKKPNFKFEETIGNQKLIIKAEGENANDLELIEKAIELQGFFKKLVKGDD